MKILSFNKKERERTKQFYVLKHLIFKQKNIQQLQCNYWIFF